MSQLLESSELIIKQIEFLADQNAHSSNLETLPPIEQPKEILAWALYKLSINCFAEARLAAKLLFARGHLPFQDLLPFLLSDLRAEDLSLLCKHTPSSLQLDSLVEATRLMGVDLADALVCFMFFGPEAPIQHLVILTEQQDKLRLLQPYLKEPVASAVHGLLKHLQLTSQEDQEILPMWEELRAKITKTINRWGDISKLRIETLQHWIKQQISTQMLSSALLRCAIENIESLPTEEQFIISLLLYRSIQGNIQETFWRPAFAQVAVQSIFDLKNLAFFPLRIELLEDLLSTGSLLLPRRDILFKLGSTRITTWPEQTKQVEQAYQELEEAVQDALDHHDLLGFIQPYCRLAHACVLLLQQTQQTRYREQADDIKSQLQQCLLEPHFESHKSLILAGIAEIESISETPATINERIKLLRESLQNVKNDPSYSVTLKTQIAELLAETPDETNLNEAEKMVREALNSLSHSPEGMQHKNLYHILGKILYRQKIPHLGEAQLHLEEALRLSQTVPDHNTDQVSIRLLLGQILFAQKQTKNSRHQWELAIQEAQYLADDEGEATGTFYLAENDIAEEKFSQAIIKLRTAENRFVDTPWKSVFLAKRLLLEEVDPQECVDFIAQHFGGEHPLHPFVEPALSQLINQYLPLLPPDIKTKIASTSNDPCLQAHAMSGLGDVDGACSLLIKYLAEEHSPFERLRTAGLLITLFSDTQNTERLQWCEIVEGLLEQYDLPEIQCDVATALYQCSQGKDPGLLRRAWSHIQRADRKLREDQKTQDSKTLAHCATVQSRILMAFLEQQMDFSTEEQAEMASWLLREDSVLDKTRLSEYMLKASAFMLHVGPLVHPKILRVVKAFLEHLCKSDPHHQREPKLQALLHRWCWIAKRQGEANIPETWLKAKGDKKFRGPVDVFPVDFLQPIYQNSPFRIPKQIEPFVQNLMIVCQIRPDLEEQIVDQLISILCKEGKDFDQDSEVANITLLANAPSWSTSFKDSLLKRLEEKLRQQWSFPLAEMQIELLRGFLDHWTTDSPYDNATKQLLNKAQSPLQQAISLFFRGRCLMDLWQTYSISPTPDPKASSEESLIETARTLLSEAAEIAKQDKKHPSFLSGVLVSAGNAFRRGASPDFDRTLAFYEEAEQYSIISEERAKLYKVRADLLLQRASIEDIGRAQKDINKALSLRRDGWLRSETLLSAADIELALPYRSRLESLRVAVQRLEEALKYSPIEQKEVIAQKLIYRLAEWKQLSPDEDGLQKRFDKLKKDFPQHHTEIHRAEANVGFQHRVARDIRPFVEHPTMAAYVEGTSCLRHPDQLFAGAMSPAMAHLVQGIPEAGREKLRKRYLADQPEKLREKIDELALPCVPLERAGKLVARVHLLSHLAQSRHASPTEVMQAAKQAEFTLLDLPEGKKEIKAALLLELSRIWAPDNATSHPVRDFSYASDLCKQAQILAQGHRTLERDALLYLARATRYRSDGDVQEHLQKSLELYERYVETCKRDGDAHGLQQGLRNLSEIQSQLGVGSRDSRYQYSVELAKQAHKIANTPISAASLAWELTQRANQLEGAEKIRCLYEAKELFEQLNSSTFPAYQWSSIENNRAVCLSSIARSENRFNEDLKIWRDRMTQVDINNDPALWAMTAHNLAETIFCYAHTSKEFLAGIELCLQALEIRTEQEDPRYRWQTAFLAGRAFVGFFAEVLAKQIPWPLPAPWTPIVSIQTAQHLLMAALEAAKKLGSGEELLMVGQSLGQLALMMNSPTKVKSLAGPAWKALNDALAFMLADEKEAVVEAEFCTNVANTMARLLAEEGIIGVGEAIKFSLYGTHAKRILLWMVRASAYQQRRLSSRFCRPSGIPSQLWLSWLQALQQANHTNMNRSLKEIRKLAPDYLSPEVDLDFTWQWLELYPQSSAVLLLRTSEGVLAAILDRPKEQRVRVYALNCPHPPLEEDEFSIAMRTSFQNTTFPEDHPFHKLMKWAQNMIVSPILKQMDDDCKHLLWVPFGVLRCLPPCELWPHQIVFMASSVMLSSIPPTTIPSKILITVADPEDRPDIVNVAAQLGQCAASVGQVFSLVGKNNQWGNQLASHNIPGLQNRPPSPEAVLQFLEETELAIFLCHGEVENEDNARLCLLSESGEITDLALSHLAEKPQRIVGKTIILLSCETGRVGAYTHRLGGIAGTLLACGAKEVVAPLWPVYLPQAIEIGKAILLGLQHAKTPAETLHQLMETQSTNQEGPTLGRLKSTTERLTQTLLSELSRKAFVTWVA